MRKSLIALFLLFLSIQTLAQPQRIISTMPNITEILFAMGLEERVVGVTTNCNYPPEARLKPKIGRETVNLEKIVSLKPDLILMLEDAQKKDVERLRELDLPVFTINPHSVDQIIDSINEIGRVTGMTDEAIEVSSKIEEDASYYRQQTLVKRSVFVVVGTKPLITIGPNNFVNDAVFIAGGINIAADAKAAYPQYNPEQLIQDDPQILIVPNDLTTLAKLKKDRVFKRLSAVRKNKVLFMDPDILFRPGPRIGEAITQMSEFISNYE